MKKKLSVVLDLSNVELIEELVASGKFRNRSHAIEYAVSNFFKEIENER